MINKKVTLVYKMDKLILTLPEDKEREELIGAKKRLEEVTTDPFSFPVPYVVGVWAKARRLYSKASGEPLV
jgi:hypothetical protein